MQITAKLKNLILKAQKNEITEHHVYLKMAKISKKQKNKEVLNKIAAEEYKHYEFFKNLSNEEVKPNKWHIFLYTTAARFLGLTFGMRLMEKIEQDAQASYNELLALAPDIDNIIKQEESHESDLIELLDEEKLIYVSSIVLGLNDALVELTGALAGFTLALQNTRLIAIVGLITGIAASLSMAASEYLSSKEDYHTKKNPLRSSFYTGLTYFITVILLILPFILMETAIYALSITLSVGILIILAFTSYVSIAKNMPFKRKFLGMAAISLGVATINFFIGMLVKQFGGDI